MIAYETALGRVGSGFSNCTDFRGFRPDLTVVGTGSEPSAVVCIEEGLRTLSGMRPVRARGLLFMIKISYGNS